MSNKMPRIYPTYENNEDKPPPRLRNIKKWLISFAGFPLCFFIFPVSCCVRNPAAHVLHGNEPPTSIYDRFAENLDVGCFGAATLVACGGCICGGCGDIEPRDF